jgi:hypothetical protein
MGKKPAPRTVTLRLDRPIKLIVEAPDGGRAEVTGTVAYAGDVGSDQVLIVSGSAKAVTAADIYPEH